MGCDYGGSGYKHTATETDKRDDAIFADSDNTETSQTATQKK